MILAHSGPSVQDRTGEAVLRFREVTMDNELLKDMQQLTRLIERQAELITRLRLRLALALDLLRTHGLEGEYLRQVKEELRGEGTESAQD